MATLLPRSLLARVYALYAGTLIGLVVLGATLFLGSEFRDQVRRSQADALALMGLVLPVAADNAVIGDYDAIRRQLQRVAALSHVEAAEFSDVRGGRMFEDSGQSEVSAPRWLVRGVAARLPDLAPADVAAGGRSYGSLRLKLAAQPIAEALWQQATAVLSLASAALVLGLALIRRPLKRWLGDLDRMASIGLAGDASRSLAEEARRSDAPAEFRRTYEALDQAALRVHAEREQATATLHAIDDAVFTCNVQGEVVLANAAAQRLLRLEPQDLVGQPLAALLPALAEVMRERPAGQGVRHREVMWHDKQGAAHVLDVNFSLVRDRAAAVVGGVLACRDVTLYRQREQALAAAHSARDAALKSLRHALEADTGLVASAGSPADVRPDIEAVSMLVSRLVGRLQDRTAQLNAIFDISPDGFLSFDAEGVVRYASPGFVRLTGLASDMVVGLEQVAFEERLRSRIVARGRAPHLDGVAGAEQVLLQLGRPKPRVLAARLHRSNINAVSQLLHLRDVTRETEVERLKSEFIVAAAHELRTPMVSIYGYLELLVTREMAPELQRDTIRRVHRQCDVMVRILNELLDLAKLEARGAADCELEPARLTELVSDALAGFPTPPDRAPPLWEPPQGEPAQHQVNVDLAKLQRALANLLSNAYKYSPAGGEVRVLQRFDAASGRCGIAVSDQGIGMTPDQLARVGERFWRADDTGTVLGTGLGVSLVREIAVLHGGSLELQSTPGEGSTFTLWLPLERHMPERAGAVLPAPSPSAEATDRPTGGAHVVAHAAADGVATLTAPTLAEG